MWYNDIEWEYKGYKCLIEFDVEVDDDAFDFKKFDNEFHVSGHNFLRT